jgi:hypothetical protein
VPAGRVCRSRPGAAVTSRRPQEPTPLRQPAVPADVLKTSGMYAPIFKRVVVVKRFVPRGFVPINPDVTRTHARRRDALHPLTEKICGKRFAKPAARVFRRPADLVQADSKLLLCSHLPLNRTATLERRENLNSWTAPKGPPPTAVAEGDP